MRHAIAALDAERLEDVGELADLPVEVEVGQRSAIARLAFPDERRLVAPRATDVAIDAVDAGVQRAADEPFRVRWLPLEHARPRRGPLELRREGRPEGLGIALGACVDVLVAHVGLRAERGGRLETSGLPEADRRCREKSSCLPSVSVLDSAIAWRAEGYTGRYGSTRAAGTSPSEASRRRASRRAPAKSESPIENLDQKPEQEPRPARSSLPSPRAILRRPAACRVALRSISIGESLLHRGAIRTSTAIDSEHPDERADHARRKPDAGALARAVIGPERFCCSGQCDGEQRRRTMTQRQQQFATLTIGRADSTR